MTEAVVDPELGQRALQANKEHLDALKTHAQNLEAELDTLDKLLDAVNAIDESDLDVGCEFVNIPGSVRATAPVTLKELLSPESPFHKDALKRSRYQGFTEVRPMKPKELEALAGAVQAETCRMYALDAQKRGFPGFLDTDATHAFNLDAEGVDWNLIAEKVSAIFMTARTAKECEIRWLGERHPEFNHEPWSQEEVLQVKALVAESTDSLPDWSTIAKRLGTRRTPLDCMRHAISRKAHHWTTEADKRLLKAIRMYGHDNWYLVARYVSEDATPSQCSSRYQKTLDESIRRTAWSPEEDVRLSAAVAAYGSSWVDVASNVPGRHNDQCRERWIDQLDPRTNKSRWSEGEDRLLLEFAREHENTSWKQISERLRNGRTPAMCRHRYAVLQKGANTVPAMPEEIDPAVLSDSLPASTNTFRLRPSFPDVSSSSMSLLPSPTENSNRVVFLEPVVSSNPESHAHHRPPSQLRTRFRTTVASDIPPSKTTDIPQSKKRRTQSRSTKTNKSTKEPPQKLTS